MSREAGIRHKIARAVRTASPTKRGRLRRGCGGTVDWKLQLRVARCVVAELVDRAVKDWKNASIARVSELPERRTKDRDEVPEDGANGID